MRTLPAAMAVLAFAAAIVHADDKKKAKDDPNQIGTRNVANCVNFYSIQKEIALGKQAAEEVSRQAKLEEDPIITEYVNRVGQNLVRNSDAKVPFTFQVVQGESPNAFALPGGFIFVYTGLLKIASEEDEFAGALAHEIAHVAARHMTCQATKSTIANIATVPLSVLLGGWAGYGARQAAGIAVPTMFLKFDRKDESEADYLGVQYLYAAGYDPTGLITIFEKLDALTKKKPGLVQKVFSTHPMDTDRIQKTQKEIDRILPAKPEYVVNTSEYISVRERLLTIESRKKSPEKDGRPVLNRRPGAIPSDEDTKDDRPTIKRRDLIVDTLVGRPFSLP